MNTASRQEQFYIGRSRFGKLHYLEPVKMEIIIKLDKGSISAFIDDIDGKVSSAEFLASWKRSPVYSWSPETVIEWLGSADMKDWFTADFLWPQSQIVC